MTQTAAPLPFRKMHGLGNDFVVLDARRDVGARALSVAQVRRISDRHTGVGCDQFIIIRPPKSPDADAFMEIRNCDGAEVEACGNATRCIAKLLVAETGRPSVTIETVAGLLRGVASPQGYTVDMGEARTDWQAIPTANVPTAPLAMTYDPVRSEVVALAIGSPTTTSSTSSSRSVRRCTRASSASSPSSTTRWSTSTWSPTSTDTRSCAAASRTSRACR